MYPSSKKHTLTKLGLRLNTDTLNLGRGRLASFSFECSTMNIITCNDCGLSVGEDDFVLQCCPNCDGYMVPNRLDIKVNPNITKIVRINANKPPSREYGKAGR